MQMSKRVAVAGLALATAWSVGGEAAQAALPTTALDFTVTPETAVNDLTILLLSDYGSYVGFLDSFSTGPLPGGQTSNLQFTTNSYDPEIGHAWIVAGAYSGGATVSFVNGADAVGKELFVDILTYDDYNFDTSVDEADFLDFYTENASSAVYDFVSFNYQANYTALEQPLDLVNFSLGTANGSATLSLVPEPSTLALLMVGGVASLRRRSRR